MRFRELLFGKYLSTEADTGERVGPTEGVGVLGLDALASAAYGPEALLTVLLPLGVAGLSRLTALTGVTIALLAIVGVSYSQTIAAYPNGGGSYTVAKENLGTSASLFAAAALLLDYLLNVAVAISAGVGALVSALPRLQPATLPLCLGILVILTMVNLRGVRAAGAAFVVPTYVFVGCMLTIIGIGVARALLGGEHPHPVVAPPHVAATVAATSSWLLVRAFASGCTAMTGVEAISNGVPIFRPPAVVGARRTLATILLLLVVLLAGVTFLCREFFVTATVPGQTGYQSVLSEVTAATVGRGPFYYLTVGSVVTILALSANTSFADFPRVCRMLAMDRFLPEHFVHRGRRLAFSHGIVALALFSGILLIAFRGITDALIPLFAIGALFAFTMSQAGMVAHWRARKGGHAKRSLVLNAIGAVATGATTCIVLLSKFVDGAWVSLLLVAAMILLFRKVRRHYDFIAEATATRNSLDVGFTHRPIAVVPLRRWDAVSLKAVRFALGFAERVVAAQVLTGDREIDDLTPRWDKLVVEPARKLGFEPPDLVVSRSEYRKLFAPLLQLVSNLAFEHPNRQIAVIVPELVEQRWYHYLIHNQTASMLKAIFLIRGGPQVVVVSAPWYLRHWRPEQRLRDTLG